MFSVFVLAPADVLDGGHANARELCDCRDPAVNAGQLIDVFAEIVVRAAHATILGYRGQSSSGIDDACDRGIILAFCFSGTREGAMPQILKDGSIKLVKPERSTLEGAADILRTVDHICEHCGAAAQVIDALLDGKIRKEVKDDGSKG